MALGRRKREQQGAWVATTELPRSPGHVFYTRLNALLQETDFDSLVEKLCRPYYAEVQGRPGIAPGIYFRMLLVGYFEGLTSQRGIAWRCSDSLSLREFLGLGATEASPDHSSLTRIRNRLPLDVHVQVFEQILQLAAEKELIRGTTVAVDATMLEANAAMRNIVRRDTGEDWKAYLRRLMQEEGLIGPDDQPTDEDLRRFDKARKGKTVSNEEWVSPTDPESRIAQMKDGTTHLAYKAEHVVDTTTDLILSAEVYPADHGDTTTMVDTVMQAQTHLAAAGVKAVIEEVVADKGYHSAENLELAESLSLRTYIPERKQKGKRRWTAKPAAFERAVRLNRQRIRRAKSRALQRRRSEVVERSFAHLCETGGGRRSWLCGLEKVRKRWLIHAAARNLGLIMRRLFGLGTARSLQGEGGLSFPAWLACLVALTLARLRKLYEADWQLKNLPHQLEPVMITRSIRGT